VANDRLIENVRRLNDEAYSLFVAQVISVPESLDDASKTDADTAIHDVLSTENHRDHKLTFQIAYGTLEKAIAQANQTYNGAIFRESYQEGQGPADRLHAIRVWRELNLWKKILENKINNNTILDSQKIALTDEIYTMLMVAQDPGNPVVTRYLIPHGENLARNISQWKAWKVAAGIALAVFAVAAVTAAVCSVMTGYGLVLLPFFATVAKFNLEATLLGVAYLVFRNQIITKLEGAANKGSSDDARGWPGFLPFLSQFFRLFSERTDPKVPALSAIPVLCSFVGTIAFLSPFKTLPSFTLSSGIASLSGSPVSQWTVAANTHSVFNPAAWLGGYVNSTALVAGISAFIHGVSAIGRELNTIRTDRSLSHAACRFFNTAEGFQEKSSRPASTFSLGPTR